MSLGSNKSVCLHIIQLMNNGSAMPVTLWACSFMGQTRLKPGGPDVALKPPDLRTIKRIPGDGNCLFRSFSYIITGSDDQHMAVHAAILKHMKKTVARRLLLFHLIEYSCVKEYIRTKNDKASVWGTDIENLLCPIYYKFLYTFISDRTKWGRYSPRNVDTALNDDVTQMSMYLWHPPAHFEVVRSIRK